MTKTCFNCGKETTADMYGYPLCAPCKSKLRLFTDETIKKYYLKNPEKFSMEIQRRLYFIEKDHIRKRIKLLNIQQQLRKFKK